MKTVVSLRQAKLLLSAISCERAIVLVLLKWMGAEGAGAEVSFAAAVTGSSGG